jgi:N-acetylglucosaminyl-diphospho-decaprenol L-rhamnosyltransferase
VAHDAAADLPACLSALHDRAGECGLRVVVVDSGSSDDTAGVARALGVSTIACANVGYGAGTNVGRRAVGEARYLVILNPDAQIVAGTVEEFVAYADSHPAIAAFAPRVVNAMAEPVASIAPFEGLWRRLADRVLGRPIASRYEPVDRRRSFGWALGCALLLRTECFDALGGFDERFFLYAEERDLLRSMQARGWQRETYPELVIRHDTGQRRISGRLFGQLFRADLHYSKKWDGSVGLIITRATLALELVRRLLLNERDAWTPLYRTALRTVLTERVPEDPLVARELQRARTLKPAAAQSSPR